MTGEGKRSPLLNFKTEESVMVKEMIKVTAARIKKIIKLNKEHTAISQNLDSAIHCLTKINNPKNFDDWKFDRPTTSPRTMKVLRFGKNFNGVQSRKSITYNTEVKDYVNYIAKATYFLNQLEEFLCPIPTRFLQGRCPKPQNLDRQFDDLFYADLRLEPTILIRDFHKPSKNEKKFDLQLEYLLEEFTNKKLGTVPWSINQKYPLIDDHIN